MAVYNVYKSFRGPKIMTISSDEVCLASQNKISIGDKAVITVVDDLVNLEITQEPRIISMDIEVDVSNICDEIYDQLRGQHGIDDNMAYKIAYQDNPTLSVRAEVNIDDSYVTIDDPDISY